MPQGKPATQSMLEIKEIKDDAVYLKTGSLRAVLMVSGINFDLLSEEEQNVVVYGYQSFINSLDYSLQFVVHSRKLNIDSYLTMLRGREIHEPNELLKTQIREYVEFVRTFVEMNAIMAKTFYVVVPYDVISVGGVSSAGGIKGFLGLGGKKKGGSQEEEDEAVKLAQLEQRVDQSLIGIRRIGLRAVRLNTEELTELFYNLYNPDEKEHHLAIAKELPENPE